jgi:aspartyl-tRNA(Asn)/glutamyl-tRNA(Gln) amidotransferase subunit C
VALSAEDIRRIAHLARLQIDEQDIPRYADSLSEILSLVEQMNAVDTQGVLPMAHPQDVAQLLRADEITETDQRAHFQEHAPLTEAGLYLVPRVIE